MKEYKQQLRDKFFKECTESIEHHGKDSLRRVSVEPEEVFNFFYKELETLDEQWEFQLRQKLIS